jgi:hypothetical chaperone protein
MQEDASATRTVTTVTQYFGIDFGTSNSALASSGPAGAVTTHMFQAAQGPQETFPSVLHVLMSGRNAQISAGPRALETYLSIGDGRLLQSIKSFVGSRQFTGTRIAGRDYSAEMLIGTLLKILRDDVEKTRGDLGNVIFAGRPVRFVGTNVDEDLALTRLRAAFAYAGWTDVTFVFEPVGAAYHYCRQLQSPEIVVVADFGAGTSDFSVLEARPHDRRAAIQVRATSGVGIAGDTFDAQIIKHVIAPALGSNATYLSDGKRLPMPRWLFTDLSRWHQMGFLNTPQNLELIRTIGRDSNQPERLEALHDLIEQNLGFRLYQAVSGAKMRLSHEDETAVELSIGSVSIKRRIERESFDRWIAGDLQRMGASLDKALATAAVDGKDVNRVFMTGGTSRVPAVRRLFEERFGAERLSYGDEFISVANGLAVMAAERARAA